MVNFIQAQDKLFIRMQTLMNHGFLKLGEIQNTMKSKPLII